MGAGRWGRALPLWALLLLASSSRQQQQQQQPGHDTPQVLYDYPSTLQKQDAFSGSPLRVTMPGMTTISPIKTYSPSHNGQVCSTWGDFHYKTFDGDIFHFPGLCNYVFSSHCKSPYEDFNVQIRRSPGPNATTTVSRVTLKLEGTVLEMSPGAILVNGKPVQLPFSQAGILIEKSSTYVRVVAKLGLVFLWNQDDGLLLELDAKYANQTCGLCGDFNGVPTYNEFFSSNVRLTAAQYGNMQKMDGPTEQCQDPLPAAPPNCTAPFDICETVLRSAPFFACHALVDVGSYVEACRQDACRCDEGRRAACICGTLAEYSRQCAHAGGLPPDWRAPELCPKTCPWNMQYRECGSPCVDTCSNHEQSPLCEEHCVDGCFCPPGTVFDDIGGQGCVPVNQCFCTYKGQPYAPGAFYSTECTNCTCSGGQWSCRDLPCPGTCSVTGGSHFSTFDEKHYTVHGDCNYVLVKPCDDKAFTVLTELRKCGLTDSETCLKSVTLSVGQTVIVVKSTGEVFVNRIYTQLPVSAGNATLFRPSSSFIIAQTNLGLQLTIQLNPIMQVFVRLEPALQGLTCGLCGNFNNIQADDFRTMSGVVEGTAAAFVNTYKTQADCPNVKNHFEDPCTLSVENEKYAQHWCGLLTDPQGPFAPCHAVVSPALYHQNCMFDTCNCEKSEDCLCAALSSYVQACAAQGVLLSGWRTGVCTKSMSCPKSLTYHYHITTCQPTCRSLSEPDVTCSIKFVPVDGCACQEGTFMDDTGKCVPLASCPCYYQGSALPNGESVHDNGAICTCTQGRLNCIGGQVPKPACAAPMVYFDCSNASAGATGAECQKSCHTLDMACYNSQCVSGCVCPDGLVSDGEGGCIHKDQCPCVHNEANYQPGETVQVECNTCTCKNRMWECTKEPCLGTCAVYGDGHYITFDGQRYSFSGSCEYTLVQDHCGKNSSSKGTFRVITENIPCGTTGTTCSKAIKIFLGSYELKLSEGKVEVMEKESAKGEPPYSIRQMGIYLIVDTNTGLVLLWDKKTSIFIQLSQDFKGKVCGLCGNYDGNTVNDFTTRSLSVVGDVQEFGNSWKLSPTCPDAVPVRDPCTANPYRKAWAQKQCSIINSAVFAACHPHVEPTKYYEACVSDACACDTGGDCECFCTAVAAYAQACNEINVCVSWRTPSICPLFCDYYNPNGSCEWHYQPCGAPCMKTCHNPSGKCSHNVRGLEGCYPKCPPEAPIFDEDKMECVQSCAPCYIKGRYYPPGSPVPSDENCHSCSCTETGIKCTYDSKACVCTYEGKSFHPGEIIYHTTDGTGGCITAICSANGTIVGKVYDCGLTTPAPSTTFSFSHTTTLGHHSTCQGHKATTSVPPVIVFSTESPKTPLPMTGPTITREYTKPFTIPTTDTSITRTTSREHISTPSTKSETTECVKEVCTWSPWLDVSHPGTGANSGDFDTLENIRAEGYRVCSSPRGVECRAAEFPAVPWQELNQTVECSRTLGLICHNKDQASGKCENYQIRILCCASQPCEPSTVMAPTTEPHPQSTVTPAISMSSPSTTPEPKSHLTKITASLTTKENEPSKSHSPSPKTPENKSHSPKVTPVEVRTVPVTNPCLQEVCKWTEWIDGSYPSPDINGGDFDTFKNLRSEGYKFCDVPTEVECRAKSFPNTPLDELEQNVTCSKTEGLLCLNKDQLPPICYNYEIRIKCCREENICGPRERTTYTTQTPKSHGVTKIVTGQKPIAKPTCQPQCSWTKWFDVDFPSSGPNGGDEETYNNIMARGEKICHKPEYITELECRSESHPGVSINETGQVVECNPDYGLVCKNQDQKGKFKMCLNYEIRVLCCEPMDNCPVTTTTSPTTPTTTSVTTKPSPDTTSHFVPITTTSPPSSPQTPTTSVSTTSTTTPSTSTHPPTPSCQPQCSWTKWFDVDFPSSGPNGGDEETYNNIMARGEKICHKPEYITELECRSESHPGVSINETGQVVECNPDYGLICRNQDQKGKFKMCFNYEIRVLCCEPMDNCPVTTTTSPTTPTTTSGTTSPETTSHSGTTTTTSTPSSPQTPMTSVSTPPEKIPSTYHTTTTPTTSTHPSPPRCEPECSWTKWFDVDFPSSGPSGGDVETYNNIIRGGEKICKKTDYITRLQCRAQNHPHVNIEKIGQVVECNPDYGLICKNQDQKGKFKMCLNYEIRVLCCEPRTNCSTTTATTQTTPTTIFVTSKSSPETTSHSVPTTTTSTPSSPQTPTTSVTTSPTTPTTTSGTTKPSPDTTSHSVPTTTTSTPSSPQTPTTSVTTSPTTPTTTSVTTKPSPDTTSHFVPITTTSPPSSPQTPTTSVSTTSTTTPSTSTHPPTPSCQPQCSWTKWFDVDFPSSGPNGGDEETYNNIMARGEKICHKPEYITELECRSESHPGVSINETGQVVECNPDYGLICRNQDQKGKFKMCLNYEIRVLCCEPMDNCPVTTTTSPTTPTTTSVTTKPSPDTTSHFVPITTTSPPSSPQTPTTSVSTTSTTTPSTSTHPPTPSCQPQCSWTKWFDVDFPSSGPNGGDEETYNNIMARGEKICHKPEYITELECRSESHPGVSINETGQVVECNPDYGLVCRNQDQKGKFKMCLNYEIRVLCCEPMDNCPVTTTTSPTTPTTTSVTTKPSPDTTSHSVPTTTTSTPSSPQTPTTSVTTSPTTPTTTSGTTKPSPDTTSHFVPITTTSPPSSPQTPTTSISTSPEKIPSTSHTTTTPSTSTHPPTPSCQPQCSWTKWFDVDFPSSGPNGGDEETYNNIMARGEKICHKPEYITELECRSESHPGVSINETGQVVECNPDYGLICRNQDQKGKFKMCLNYEIRVLCCEPMDNCPVTTTTSPTTPTTTSVTTKPSPDTTSHSVPFTTTSPPSSPQTPTTSVSTISTTTPSTSTHPPTPSCQPQCSWTKWFDVDFPSSGPNGGDEETYNNIMARGEKICHKPEYITELECRSESHPGVSINETGQVVECNPDYGLVCRNQDQKGKFKMCLNYEIRVLCCEPMDNCPVTTTTSPTTPTTTSVTTKPSLDTTSHSVPTTMTSTPSSPQTPTTSVTTSPTTPTTTSGTTKPSPDTTSHFVPITTTSPPSSPQTPTTSISTSPEKIPSTSHTTTTPSTSTHPPTPSCQPQCSWTKWFDVDFPSSGPNGGDEETYNNIMARGEKICHKPEYITELECRSESHPGVSINETGQVVECNPDYGLICRNQDQKGKFKMCLNYEIRVLCCEPMDNCPVTTTTSPTTPMTTSVTTKPSPDTTSHFVPITTTSPPSSPQTPTTSVSTISTTTPSTSTHPPTPSCQPQCSWTKWFDVDFPSSGPNGGDEETYNNIMARGEKICHKPEYITELECRSESHPGVSINETGQVVECNPDYGLICRNQDQKGKFKMCLNYEIRVLCCEPMDNCPVTTTTSPTTPTTTSVTTKPSPDTTSHFVPFTTTSPPSSPQTPTTSVSTISTTTPSTSTHPPMPSCQPQCSWTKWFDVDFPSSGPNGGDEETYNNIMARGEKICHKPEYITELECRSESHPGVSINETGQVVECKPDYGLVCRNQDQKGKFKMCLNYEIRVLCCEPMDNCPSTMPSSSLSPTIPTKTSATTFLPSSKIPPFHVSTSISTLSPHSSSSCYCFLSGKVYPSGTVIYNQTDNAGYCYSAICNKDCSVERIAESCPTVAPTPSPSTSASTTTAIATSATTPRLPSASSSHPPVTTGKSNDCLNAEPPRKKGESWFIHKCKKATCEGDDVITLTPVSCPPVKELSCANGYPPVKVYDDADHCCYHYECQCVCSGWGDPHYITFDGIYYTFLDNCTYVLVQQIHPVYDHFRVLIDNYFCDAQDGLSCPRSITVEYKDNRIVLIRTLVRGMMENEIIFNNRTVSAGFKKDGIVISTRGIKMFVTIPEIGVQVMFSGMLFSVEVPFTKFANNTEGQCGTCTNDKRDECRLPDGKMASSCSAMSGAWKYHVPGQPYCAGPSPTPAVPSPTTSKPCPPSLLCMLIMSEVFEACHHVIPPEPYFEGCVYDQCHIPDGQVWCSSLELYASLCAAEGVCIDWRGETQGQCALTCPDGQVYQACGPIYSPTCQSPQGSINSSLGFPDNIGVLTEGCFCPPGTTMFSFDSNVCVPATPSECHSWCTGPNGEPIKPGAAVPSGLCETCSCVLDDNPESKTSVVRCEPIVCDTHCPTGFEYQEQPGHCCGKCVQVACVVHTNGSSVQLVKPGQTWSGPENKCVQYECEKVNGQLILVTAKKACPPVLCSPDQVRKSEDGCCLVCPPPPQVYPCAVGRRSQVIRKGGCISPAPVEVTYCQGNCGDTMSIYSFESNALEHRCRCCRELRTSRRNVTLACPDGSSLAFAFSQVEECGCQRLRCDKPDGGESGESGESEEEPAGSRERGAAPAAPAPR